MKTKLDIVNEAILKLIKDNGLTEFHVDYNEKRLLVQINTKKNEN
jgi:hypothetical protein